jgi:hypothetical protein
MNSIFQVLTLALVLTTGQLFGEGVGMGQTLPSPQSADNVPTAKSMGLTGTQIVLIVAGTELVWLVGITVLEVAIDFHLGPFHQ